MFRALLFSAHILAVCVAPAKAQSDGAPLTFPLAEVLGLAAQPYLDATAFAEALDPVLPHAMTPAFFAEAGERDPYLWSISGAFGPGSDRLRPGARFGARGHCARYGRASLDLFAERTLRDPEAYMLYLQTRPQFDDADTWPEGAVARLYCEFVWDDERVVEIMLEPATRTALEQTFDILTSVPQEETTGAAYGEDGYRIDATSGRSDTIVRVENARMSLTLGHQAFSFRSFLMGGGV